jgi:hypothetical protein
VQPDRPAEDNPQGTGLPPRDPVPVPRPEPLDPPTWRAARLSRRPATDAQRDEEPAESPDEAAQPEATKTSTSYPTVVPADPAPPVVPPAEVRPEPNRFAGPSLRFGRPASAEPPPIAAAPPRPLPTPGAGRLIRVGMWGATSGGKTTFLAALPLAVLSESGDHSRWTINGATPEATEFLLEMTELLDHERRFPQGSMAGTPLSWHIFGEPDDEPDPASRGRRGRGLLGRPAADREPVEFVLDLQDMPGRWFLMGKNKDDAVKAAVLKHLAESDGLLYLFDPILDATKEAGDQGNFQFFHGVLEHLVYQLRREGKLVNGRLPHHVAVCITKFDHPVLFSKALRSDWVSTHQATNQPHIPNKHADKFFDWLCDQMPDSGAARVRAALGRYFHPDRVAYFVCSAIGFRLGEGGRFDPSDYANVETADDVPRIRDAVRPINILEPVIGLERRIRTGSW